MATLQHDSGVYLASLLIDPMSYRRLFLSFRLSFFNEKTVKTSEEKLDVEKENCSFYVERGGEKKKVIRNV